MEYNKLKLADSRLRVQRAHFKRAVKEIKQEESCCGNTSTYSKEKIGKNEEITSAIFKQPTPSSSSSTFCPPSVLNARNVKQNTSGNTRLVSNIKTYNF